MSSKYQYFKTDIIAGLVVALVAIPLCLGIAAASGASLFSGMISGIIGGIVIGTLSRSGLSVSGPAAGLITIVATSIASFGFPTVALAILIAGIFQILLGIVKAGGIAYYIPSTVIEGMLTAIGITIVLTNLPTMLGLAKIPTPHGLMGYGFYIWAMITNLVQGGANHIALGIGVLALAVLIFWGKIKVKSLKLIPGAVMAVIVGLVGYVVFQRHDTVVFNPAELVQLPIISEAKSFHDVINFPDFSQILNPNVWVLAFTITMVASVETLLTIGATDKIDPLKRITPTNRELFAQGVGNALSGLFGGLPITSVIVRSRAGLDAGGRTKMTTITHGTLLFLGVLLIPKFLNTIPMACLGAILALTGYNLCNPAFFIKKLRQSKHQWIPFVATILAILEFDLLRGVAIGIMVAIYFILRGNMKFCYTVSRVTIDEKEYIYLMMSEEVSFLKKATIMKTLSRLKKNSNVIMDAQHTVYIDFDVLEIIREFAEETAPQKHINLKLINFKEAYEIPTNKRFRVPRHW
ncbi:MAG: hypothetical protein LBT27_09505 [Prevotellaceae bacterium]|jgi:MFS superfamily sulfate permease-like transporter|nr:hypothetical protein [Prevotellaceae bacterium]